MSTDDYQRTVDLKPVGGNSLLAGRALSTGEIAALFETCAHDPKPQGVRDAAVLGLGISLDHHP